MKDPCIRQLLRKTELTTYINDPHSKVVEELKLPVAKARIDIAVINGHLHGYEIKSASDTLQRLPDQIMAYEKVFDYLTIVTEGKYHERILNMLPDWIGLSVCKNNAPNEYEIIKAPTLNTNKNGFYVAQLLWHSELVELLFEQDIPFTKKTRTWLLCELATKHIELPLLSKIVRQKLKNRQDWKLKQTIH